MCALIFFFTSSVFNIKSVIVRNYRPSVLFVALRLQPAAKPLGALVLVLLQRPAVVVRHLGVHAAAVLAGRARAARGGGGGVVVLRAPPAAPARGPAATLEEIEREAIRNALRDCNGGRRCAARRLGIAESTLYEKIRRYDLGTAGREG